MVSVPPVMIVWVPTLTGPFSVIAPMLGGLFSSSSEPDGLVMPMPPFSTDSSVIDGHGSRASGCAAL